MPPGPVESNQADFDRRYQPIDAARYNTQQTQAYYERMRAQINERSKSLLRGAQGVQTGGVTGSMFQAVRAGRYEPRRREYRTQSRRDRAYTRDVVERTMAAPMNFYDAFNEFGAEFGVGEPVDQFTNKYVFGSAGMGMGTMKALGHSMLTGTAAGLAAYGAGEGALQYTGIREGFNQFDEIKKLQGASRPMTAGTAAGPNGRMNREMAANVLNNMSSEARLNNMQREGESLSDLKEQAGILGDYQLLEGARSADEFEQTFKKLKQGVQRVMEVMGTTFEEGTKLMKDFRNAGVDPMQGVNMIDQGRLTSAQFGNNFKEGHASGMQTAMAMRGTGFSMGAGYQMGQYASGMAQTIYEGNYLDDKTMFNIGGQRGVQQSLQRSSMRFMESPQFTSMMMAAQGQGGGFNPQTVMQTLSGERGSMANARAAGQNMSSLGDILSFRANNRSQFSELMENNPGALPTLQVRSVMDLARRAGQDPQSMTQNELAEFAGMTGINTPDEFRANMAAAEALPETLGRREVEERRTAEARARDRFRGGIGEGIAEGFREAPVTRGLIRTSAAATMGTRNSIQDASRQITNDITRTFTGRSTVTASGQGASFFSELDQDTDFRSMKGGIREDMPDVVSSSDAADQLEIYQESNANNIQQVKIPDSRTFSDGLGDDQAGVSLTKKERQRLGIPEKSLTQKDNPAYAGGRYISEKEIMEYGVSGSIGDPKIEEGKSLVENFVKGTELFGGFNEGSMDFYTGLFSAATGNSQTTLSTVEGVQSTSQADENLAEAISITRDEQTEEPALNSLSDDAQQTYQDVFNRAIDRDRIVEIRNKAGEDGNQEMSRYVQEVLKENVPGLPGEVGSDKLKNAAAQRIKNNNDGFRGAFGHFLKQARQMGAPVQGMEEFFEPGPNVENIASNLETGQSLVNAATSQVFESVEVGGVPSGFDKAIENRIDSSRGARDALIARSLVEEGRLDKSEFSDAQETRYQNLQAKLPGDAEEREDLTEQYIKQVKQSDEVTLGDLGASLQSAGEGGILAGSGEQSSAVNGTEMNVADPDSDQRQAIQDEMLRVAQILEGMKDTVDDMQTTQEQMKEEVFNEGVF